jgi:phosphatidylserine decarboxylase
LYTVIHSYILIGPCLAIVKIYIRVGLCDVFMISMYAVLLSISFLLILLLMFWRLVFLRDPARQVQAGDDIVAPADGVVMDVVGFGKRSAIVEKRFFGSISLLCSDVGRKCTIISIFMSPFNVHVNRMPCDGRILAVKHSKGSFHPANRLALGNEKNEILVQAPFGRLKVVQVAGFIARRIECWVKKNEKVVKGQRFGRINLASQVVVVLPDKVRVVARPGQRVLAGTTVIAKP